MRTTFFLLICTFNAAIAQSPINAALTTLAQDTALLHSAWGFYAVEVVSGKVVAERQPQLSLIPASSLKTVTTASALAMLGANYTYDTRFAFRETPMTADDDAQGDFVLQLSGDPSLCSQYNEFAISPVSFYNNLLQAAQHTQSPFLTENTTLEPITEIWDAAPPDSWEVGDLTEPFGVTAQGFNICDNELRANLRITIDSSLLDMGDTPYKATILDLYPNFSAQNTELFVDPELNLRIDTSYHNDILIDTENSPWLITAKLTKLDSLYPVKAANRNVWFDFETMLNDDIAHIAATHRPHNQPLPRSPNLTILYTHTSPPLSYLVRRCNEKSLNLYAEAFLKTIGKQYQKDGTDEAGIHALVQYWQQRGIKFDGVAMADGCGISRQNMATPYFLASFLRTVYQDPTIGQTFYNSLAVAGETGTLETWFRDTPARGKIRAKTGSMRRVLTYTGYAPDHNGNLIAFSLMVNNYAGKPDDMRKKLTWVLSKLTE
jgi:serine-type D-Ala-D-Ala carboxypeptidase/endopeptidase (penicillin-binding protein 4)